MIILGPLPNPWRWLKNKLLKRQEQKRKKNGQERKVKYTSQKAAYKFCIAAFLLFGFQGFVALAGAVEKIFPDLPSPVPFQVGRAIHLNFSLIWPLLGLMGATYYFFVQEARQDLFSIKLTHWHFWLTFLTGLGILASLFLHLSEGREYLEAILPLKVGVLLSIVLFMFIIGATLLKSRTGKLRPILVAMLLGIFTLFILYLPNLFFYPHPSVDEIVKFWFVHIWEEMSFELIGSALTASLLISIAEVNRKTIEKLLYIDLAFIVLTGFFATGHHYYYIGTPEIWIIIGGIFSALQVLPILLMVFSTYHTLKTKHLSKMEPKAQITMGFLLSSVFYHLVGAGILGLMMAVPRLNLYVHGTLMTSAHAHLALFGVFGFLVLGLCFWILTDHLKPEKKFLTQSCLALLLLNAGLLIMGGALVLAGLTQAYLWRVAGMDFMEVIKLLKPYMVVRAIGGMLFTAGDLLLVWNILKLVLKEKSHFFAMPNLLKQVKRFS